MFFLRLKNIIVAVNKKTDDELLIFTVFATWVISSILLFVNGYDFLELNAVGDPGSFKYYLHNVLSFILHSSVYAIIAIIALSVGWGLFKLGKWMISLGSIFKEATVEEFDIEIDQSNKSKVTFS